MWIIDKFKEVHLLSLSYTQSMQQLLNKWTAQVMENKKFVYENKNFRVVILQTSSKQDWHAF